MISLMAWHVVHSDESSFWFGKLFLAMQKLSLRGSDV